MRRGARLWLALAAALAVAPAPARATTLRPADVPPELTRGPIELHPYIGYLETYDSNIFLLPSPVSSWVHTPSAGVRIPGQLGDANRYQLSYDGEYRVYSHDPGVGNGLIQAVDGRYWHRSPAGLAFRAHDAYLNTIDQGSTELTGLRRRWRNSARVALGYEPEDGPFHVTADGDDTRYKYVSDDPVLRQQLDRYERTWGGKIGWQAQPKTVAYAEYHRQLIHYTNNPLPSRDSKSHLVDFGLEGDLTAKISGKAQVGFVDRKYDQAPAAGLGRDTNNLTAQVALDYQPQERSKVDLTFTRSLEESAFDINQFYIATAGLLSFTHTFTWNLIAHPYAGLEFDKYPTTTQIGPLSVNRRDYNYQGGMDVEYPLGDYLKVGAGYLYRARFSKGLSGQFNYRDQITNVSATVTF